MRRSAFLTGLLLMASLLGCRQDDAGASTSGTSLYLFDDASHQVFVWKDLSAAFDAATPPAADITLSASLLNSLGHLAWGGMALDVNRNQLYLVSTTGTVVRISNLRLQTGAITNTGDIASFTLNSGDRVSGGFFSQVSLDPSSGALYVTETSDTNARIWVVSNPGSIANAGTAPSAFLPSASLSDKGGTGVAAGPGQVFAYFDGGSTVTDNVGNNYDGRRLRRSSDGLSYDAIIIDNTNAATTQLGPYGSLALDRSNNLLYVGVNTAKSVTTSKAVLAFRTGNFLNGFNLKPEFTLDQPALTDLRVLAHAGNKDWLVGLRGTQPTVTDPTTDAMFGDAVVWKSSSSSSASTKTLSFGSSYQFRGAALDGSGG